MIYSSIQYNTYLHHYAAKNPSYALSTKYSKCSCEEFDILFIPVASSGTSLSTIYT